MSNLAPRLVPALLALALTVSAVGLGAAASAPMPVEPIAPFGRST